MQIFFLTTLTMTAFAANSVLNRIGVATFGMDPIAFAVVRVMAGAVLLTILVQRRGGAPFVGLANRWRGALALAVYMIGFSWAYLSLGAGLGALILFGVLQVVMFAWAVVKGQQIPMMRWVGATVAMCGLVILLWPSGAAQVPVIGGVAMVMAGVGWAVYTILGQGERDALVATAGNFVLCLPIVVLFLLAANLGTLSIAGVLTAVIAGAVTSGLGYALWYRVLPQLATTTAAIAQLSVPVIAVAAGVIFLSEPLTQRLVTSGVLVLGGIALSLVRFRQA